MRRWQQCLPMLGGIALGGCMPAATQVPPQATVAPPASWLAPHGETGAVQAKWWSGFGDPKLNAIVERALAGNLDVLTAAARVEEARAAARIARSTRLPALQASGAAGYSRSIGATTGSGVETTALQPEVSVSWDADLFGRLRALDTAARLRYRASQAEQDGVALAVAAQTARSYFLLLSLDAQLFVTRETLVSRQQALRLAEDQARVGYSSQLQLTQAQSEYEAVSQAIPQLEQAIREIEIGLSRLIGEAPGRVDRSALLGIDTPHVPVSLPSELLRRRPDLVQAELMVAAADANLTSRRREFLPSVQLSAGIGALLVNGRDYDPVTIWDVGGSLLAPLFAGGRLTAQVDAASAQRDQAAYSYKAAVLAAFGEVESALNGVGTLHRQLDRAMQRRTILQRSLRLARDRYRGGYASYIEELDAQRNLYTVELDAISVREAELSNLVSLYESLGGGWGQQ